MSTWVAEDKNLSGIDFILMEDGFYLLQENDNKLLQEQTAFGDMTWNAQSVTSTSWLGEGKTLGTSDFILLEDGFYMLQEDDSKLVIDGSGTVSWYEPSKSASSWTGELKIGIDDVLGIDGSSDILGTEGSDNIGTEQAGGTGVTWSGTNKT